MFVTRRYLSLLHPLSIRKQKALSHFFFFAINLQGLPYIDVKIKWPNDLYLNGLKVGGILCTSTYRSRKFHVSVGKYPLLFFYKLR